MFENGTVKKMVVLAMLGLALWGFNAIYLGAIAPDVGTKLALNTVNGGGLEWSLMNVFQQNKNLVVDGSVALFAGAALLLFQPWKYLGKLFVLALLASSTMSISGCLYQPYDVPEYVEIAPNQTAFIIPLDEDAKGSQVKFGSANYLDEHKAATKRIQIPHRWVDEGRMPGDGKYIATIKVITVDRSPVTQEWSSSGVGGASKGKDKAIWVESGDSVGFSMGFSCTAFVNEADTAQFLYMYPSGSLANVMETEVRARIQQVAALGAAKYRLDDLRARKSEVGSAVTSDVTVFFKTRGITITTVGMFGGMTYENPDIQKAIDGTFVTQQEKVNAKAMLEAQADKNTRIKSEAEATADAARTKAKGDADGKLSIALAEVASIKAMNAVVAESSPQLISLKALEVEKARVEKWHGEYPGTVVGSGSNTWVGLQSTNGMTAAVSSTPTK
ncbi:MAG: hypothetical protein HY225_03100 [Candidatus Vogelbacteria bacterium]|nr:hypothetical protein [Candidatus Vogelbacteria bacterium]